MLPRMGNIYGSKAVSNFSNILSCTYCILSNSLWYAYCVCWYCGNDTFSTYCAQHCSVVGMMPPRSSNEAATEPRACSIVFFQNGGNLFLSFSGMEQVNSDNMMIYSLSPSGVHNSQISRREDSLLVMRQNKRLLWAPCFAPAGNVSALIPAGSQLHLDYISAQLNTLQLFLNLNTLSTLKVYFNEMKLRPPVNAVVLIRMRRSTRGTIRNEQGDTVWIFIFNHRSFTTRTVLNINCKSFGRK